jgi:hypothetical protein
MNIKSITRSALLITAFLAPALAFASSSIFVGFSFGGGNGGGSCTSDICSVAQNILYLINSILVPVIFALAFIVFIYGVAQAYIFSRGDEGEVKKGHQLVLWGIIGFVVMVSLWGLVNVVANTFGLGGVGAPPLPTSYPQ